MAHVPKYILKKAVRLNKQPKDEVKEKLVKEITHWLQLSGVPYADIKPHNHLVIALEKGAFADETAIKKGFDELMDDY